MKQSSIGHHRTLTARISWCLRKKRAFITWNGRRNGGIPRHCCAAHSPARGGTPCGSLRGYVAVAASLLENASIHSRATEQSSPEGRQRSYREAGAIAGWSDHSRRCSVVLWMVDVSDAGICTRLMKARSAGMWAAIWQHITKLVCYIIFPVALAISWRLGNFMLVVMSWNVGCIWHCTCCTFLASNVGFPMWS